MAHFQQPDFILSNRRRLASPNERRVIARQNIGHQRRLIIGAVYTSYTHHAAFRLEHSKQPFLAALKFCIEEHPLLSTVILNEDTEAPEFATPKTLDLTAHLEVRDVDGSIPEDECIESLMAQISDEQLLPRCTTPAWKVVLVPLSPNEISGLSRLLVLFTNYHSHGDGRSGLAFQDSFHKGLSRYLMQASKDQQLVETICETPNKPLLPPIEEGGKLTLSWSYLLSPLLGTYFPKPIVSWLGIRDSWLQSEDGIWRGEKTFFEPTKHSTGLVLINIEASIMDRVLQRSRERSTTFTGLLQHLIARSLAATSGFEGSNLAFNAGVAIDMRHLFEGLYTRGSMMNCVTGHSELVQYSHSHEEPDWASDPSSQLWEAARKTTASLKCAAGTLHNQPIGLLQYLKEFRPWTTGQIGKERDMSFEISNLGAFGLTSSNEDHEANVSIERAVFSQPAKATGSLLDFNPVSIKGGPLALTITWQLGVLGLREGTETAFVKSVGAKVKSAIYEIAAVPT
ncbi:hypothetical protein Q7P37_003632 [Cladosporium fusiforme]